MKLAVSRDGTALAAVIAAAGKDARIVSWNLGDLLAVAGQSSAASGAR